MVTTPKVNLGKDLGPMQLIKHIIQSRNGESILDDVVCGPRTHIHEVPSIVGTKGQELKKDSTSLGCAHG